MKEPPEQPNSIQDKLVDWALKGLSTVLFAGSGVGFANGTWFGERIFSAYLNKEGIRRYGVPSSDVLYRAWGSKDIFSAFDSSTQGMLLVLFLSLILLMAHVLFKGQIRE